MSVNTLKINDIKKKGCLALFLFGLSCCLRSQTVPYIPFTPKEGFPSFIVYNMVQEEKGYIWLGTNDGLFRWGGKMNFKLYENPSLKGVEVFGLSIDNSGTLWFNNFQGQIGYLKNDSLQVLNTGPFGSMKVNHFMIDKKTGLIYFYSSHDIYSYDPLDGSYRHCFHCEDCVAVLLNKSVIIYESEFYIIQTTYNLQQIDPGQKVNELPYDSDQFYFLNSTYDLQKIWVYDRTNKNYTILDSLEFRTAPTNKFGISHIKDFLTIYEDDLGYTWINTGNGTWPVTPDLKLFNPASPIIEGHRINHVMHGKEGGYWVSTHKDGVLYLPSLNIKKLASGNSGSIKVGNNGRLFIANYSRKIYILEDGKVFYTIDLDESLYVRSILDFNDFIIVSFVSGSGPKVYDLKTGNSYDIKLPLVSGMVTSDREVYISHYFQTYRVTVSDLKEYVKEVVGGKTNGSDLFRKKLVPVEKSRARSFMADRFHPKIWIGNIDNLKFYDFEKDTIVVIEEFKTWVTGMAQTNDSKIWVATENGLYCIDNDKIILHLTTDDGLLSNMCFRLFVDDAGHLWICTSKGLMKMDGRTGELEKYDIPKAIIGEAILSVYKKDQNIWISSSEGVFLLEEKELNSNSHPPPIFLTNVKIWEKDTTLSDSYILPFKNNNVTIQFEGLSYRSLGKFQYKHRMLGIDSSWTISPATVNFARYPQLSPGDYEFQVKAINEDGVESPQTARTAITIRPPFWQTWWFQGLIAIGVIGLSIVGTMFWQKRKQKLQSLETRIDELKMEALNSQMNPHFIFNALNAIQLTMYQQDRRESMTLLSLFSDMMRSLFEHSQKTEISLEEELQFMKNYLELEKLRFEDRINISLKIDENLDIHHIMIPPLLLQPIVENCFKHGLLHKKGKGNLEVRFCKQEQLLKVIVKDDGIGRKRAAEFNKKRNKHNRRSSTLNIEERIQLLNNQWQKQDKFISMKTIDLYNSNGQANGTQVELVIKP